MKRAQPQVWANKDPYEGMHQSILYTPKLCSWWCITWNGSFQQVEVKHMQKSNSNSQYISLKTHKTKKTVHTYSLPVHIKVITLLSWNFRCIFIHSSKYLQNKMMLLMSAENDLNG